MECHIKHWTFGFVSCPVCGDAPHSVGETEVCMVCKGAGLIPCGGCEPGNYASFLINLEGSWNGERFTSAGDVDDDL